MAEHLREREVRLRHGDVAPQVGGDLVGRARALLEQAVDLVRAAAVQLEALVDQLAVLGHRVPVAGQHELHVHLTRGRQRVEVLHQRLRALGRAVARAGEQRVGGDVTQQVVGGDQDAALAVVEDRVRGGVAGAVMHVQGAVAQLDRVAVAQRPGDLHARAPGAEGARDRLQRRHHVLGDAVAQHDVAREVVVGLGLGGEALHERDRGVDGRHLGARVRGHERHQAEVVDVLVGEDHQLDVLERVAEPLQAAAELVERRARVGPGVHQRERRVVDQVDVDPPDGEGGGDGEPVDAGRGRRCERVLAALAQERISSSTSSRLSSMCSRETTDSRLRRSSGSVLEGRTLKCQSS